MDQVSYALGLGIGRQLSDMGAKNLNIDDFAQAIKDILAGKKPQVDDATAQRIVQEFFQEQEKKQRAAAAEQLTVWADRSKVRIIKHEEGADPAAVVYDAIASCKAKKTDVLLIDTAGRLHNKKNLMEELKKIDRVVLRDYPEADYRSYIVLDATTGQNAVSQVEIF